MLPLATGRHPSVSPGGVSVAPFASLNLAGYVGDSAEAVAANRALMAASLGLPADRLAVMDSVHGADVAVVEDPGLVVGVDALVTREPGLAVVALGADCVPMALIGTDGITVAAAHCGWRGLAVDIVGAVVEAMRSPGNAIAHVVLGPAVCGSCYPVPPERAEELRDLASAVVCSAALVTTPDGQPGIDVRSGVVARLLELGIHSVARAGGCTVEDPGLFSYRRDGRTGRQGIAVCTVAPTADSGEWAP